MTSRSRMNDTKTENAEVGTRKSLGTSIVGAGPNSKDRAKPSNFSDLFVSPNEPKQKMVSLHHEMHLQITYTNMKSDFGLTNHPYFHLIKDVKTVNL